MKSARLKVALAFTLAAATTVAWAQSDAIETRRNLMKSVGAATRTGSQMAKGDVPFDLAKAKEVLAAYARAADTMHNHYPDGSQTGGNTTASPKIWDNQADFRARFDAWSRDIQKASAETTDLESFRASFGTVSRSCQGCHQAYRVGT